MIYQIKITLNQIRPPIWRRVQVAEETSFATLHEIVQMAMGWQDYHLHEFEVVGRRIGPKIEDDFYGGSTFDEIDVKLCDVVQGENAKLKYTYDFGDGWVHEIRLEKILPRKEGVDYPICIAGKRACPPEDCGGVWGYESLLEAIRDESHEEHERMLEWLGGEFDPEYFDPDEVSIDDADARLKLAFG